MVVRGRKPACAGWWVGRWSRQSCQLPHENWLSLTKYRITKNNSGKLRKNERNTVIFFIRIQIYHVTIRIIQLHQYNGVHSKKLNAHKSECFFAHGRKIVCTKIVRGRNLFTIIPYSDMNKKYVNKFVELVKKIQTWIK